MISREAPLRSQTPINQSAVNPDRTSLSSSSSGTWSSRRISRPVPARKLIQPDQRIPGHHHRAGHPFAILAERLHFRRLPDVFVDLRRPGREAAEPDLLLFTDQVDPGEKFQEEIPEQGSPAGADVLQLPGKGVRGDHGRTAQHRDEVLVVGTERRLAREELADGLHQRRIGGAREHGLIEELGERREGRVRVGKPEHEHLFHRSFLRRPVPRRPRRELTSEPGNGPCHGIAADPGLGELECAGERRRLDWPGGERPSTKWRISSIRPMAYMSAARRDSLGLAPSFPRTSFIFWVRSCAAWRSRDAAAENA